MIPLTSLAQLTSRKNTLSEKQNAGLNQIINNDLELDRIYQNLLNAPGRNYDLSDIKLPKSEFLDKLITTKIGAPMLCNDPSYWTCSKEDQDKYGISYGDYLKLKLKVRSQSQAIKDFSKINTSIDSYATNSLSGDTVYGGKQITVDINNNFTDMNKQVEDRISEANSQRYSGENLRIAVADAATQQTKLIGSSVAAGFNATLGIGRISLMSQGLNPETFTKPFTQGLKQFNSLQNTAKILDVVNLINEIATAFRDKPQDPLSPETRIKIVKCINELNKTNDKDKMGSILGGMDGVYKISKSISEINDLVDLKKQLESTQYKNTISKDDLNRIQAAIVKNQVDIFFGLTSTLKDVIGILQIPTAGIIDGISNSLKAAEDFRNAATNATDYFGDRDLRNNYLELETQNKSQKIKIDARIDRINFVSSKVGDYISNYSTASDPGILIKQITSCSTQYNTSHIGSASCSFPTANSAVFKAADIPVQNKIYKQQPESIQAKNTYTNGTIVQTPIDITLTWNQNIPNPLDLDSHLATPNGEHLYFPLSERGNLNSAPNAFLYRDSIPPNRPGAEQTRVTKLQEGEYRFYVHNYSDTGPSGNTSNPNRLSNSNAQVKIFEGGKPLTNVPNDPNNYNENNPDIQAVGNPYPNGTFNVPTNTPGNTWSVFRLNARTGILTPVNTFGNASSGDVPKLR